MHDDARVLARDEPADLDRREPRVLKRPRRLGRAFGARKNDHAEAAVECPQHLRLRDRAVLSQPAENRRRREGREVELRG